MADTVKFYQKLRIEVVEIDDGLYDLFDYDTGECLNIGCMFPFLPNEEEVKEFLQTGKITGKLE